MTGATLEWILQNLEAVSGTLSALATVALVALYRRQGRILDAQKEIQRVEQLPEIDLVDRTFDGDDLEVAVSNYGPGLAKNVRFCTAIAAPLDDQIEPILLDSRARKVREDGQKTLEQTVNPHETRVRFRGEPRVGFQLNGEDSTFADFSTAFNNLRAEGPEVISFQIYVVVDDQLGGCQSKRLFRAPRMPIQQVPDDKLDDASSLPELPTHPSLETLWNHSGMVYRNHLDYDLIEPDCRN